MTKRETPIPAVVEWLFGPVMLAAGGLGLAAAFGLIRLEASRTHAPLWMIGAIGVSFAAMGLVLLLDGIEAQRRVRGWLALVFLVSLASVFNWVAFGPGERHFTTRTSVGSGAVGVTTVAEGGEFSGRLAFGVFAVLLDLLIASPLILWLWRRVRPSAGPGSKGKGASRKREGPRGPSRCVALVLNQRRRGLPLRLGAGAGGASSGSSSCASESTGNSTMRPSSGKEWTSTLKPVPSLWGKATPMRVQALPFLPSAVSNSRTAYA